MFPEKPKQRLNPEDMTTLLDHHRFADQYIKFFFRMTLWTTGLVILHYVLLINIPPDHPNLSQLVLLQRIMVPILVVLLIFIQGLMLFYRYAVQQMIDELKSKNK